MEWNGMNIESMNKLLPVIPIPLLFIELLRMVGRIGCNILQIREHEWSLILRKQKTKNGVITYAWLKENWLILYWTI